MPIAIDTSRPFDYVLKCDRTAERPTVFQLARMSVAVRAPLQDGLVVVDNAAKTSRVNSGTTELQTLRLGLLGWSDFYDAEGRPVPFETNAGMRTRGGRAMVTDACLDRLSNEHQKELAEAIIEGNVLTADDRKNS